LDLNETVSGTAGESCACYIIHFVNTSTVIN